MANKQTKDEKIKSLKQKIKGLKSYYQMWDSVHLNLFNQTSKDLIASRKTIKILLPLVKQNKIEELLSELSDLREEKRNNELLKKLKEKDKNE